MLLAEFQAVMFMALAFKKENSVFDFSSPLTLQNKHVHSPHYYHVFLMVQFVTILDISLIIFIILVTHTFSHNVGRN